MSAISSLSSFGARLSQGAISSSAQQAQRGTTFGSVAAARAGNTSSAYCPTCGGGSGLARSSSSASSSYCPTCNAAGGRQSSITNFSSNNTVARASATTNAHTSHQGGKICVGCAYQGH